MYFLIDPSVKKQQDSYSFWEKKFHDFHWIFMIFPWLKQQQKYLFSLTFIIFLYFFSRTKAYEIENYYITTKLFF